MASICLGLICGTVGFLASYIFVSKIYTMIKLDWRYIILILIDDCIYYSITKN